MADKSGTDRTTRYRRIHLAGSLLLLVVLSLTLNPLDVRANTQPVTREYQVKAAFLYNFTKFVEWPAHQFTTESSPIIIGVLGRNPFGGQLQEAVRGRTVRGRHFEIRIVQTPEEALDVHLLFVASGEENRLEQYISRLHEAGVLTVGETAVFQSLGGIITFTLNAGQVRFFIDRASAEPTGIQFSAQLLQLALSSL